MIDTGGTLAKATDLMMELCERKSNLYTRHLIWRCLRKNRKFSIIRTNSYGFYPLKRQSDRVLSCAPLFADVMHMVHIIQLVEVLNVVTRR
jgi:ribose-phosphate pyrophosphokinase